MCQFFSGQSGEASWWRACYQRGLPCLVFVLMFYNAEEKKKKRRKFATSICGQSVPNIKNSRLQATFLIIWNLCIGVVCLQMESFTISPLLSFNTLHGLPYRHKQDTQRPEHIYNLWDEEQSRLYWSYEMHQILRTVGLIKSHVIHHWRNLCYVVWL